MESINYGRRSMSAGGRSGEAAGRQGRWTHDTVIANLSKESNVREPDGRSCYGRKPYAGFESGDAKQGRGGNSPDEDNKNRELTSGEPGEGQGGGTEQNLSTHPLKGSCNNETARGHTQTTD